MLLLVGMMAAALGWMMHNLRQQTIAVAALMESGFSCKFEYASGEPRTVTELLRTWTGEKQPRNVVRLRIDTSRLTLAELEQLRFGPRKVSSGALPRLGELTQLEELRLSGKQVTDDWLVHIGGLTQLKLLDLSDTRVTDAGMTNLQGLTRLKTTSLFDTLVTDAGAEQLKGRFAAQGVAVHHWTHPVNDSSEPVFGCDLRFEPATPDDEMSERSQTWFDASDLFPMDIPAETLPRLSGLNVEGDDEDIPNKEAMQQ
jgi:hypothetical protein